MLETYCFVILDSFSFSAFSQWMGGISSCPACRLGSQFQPAQSPPQHVEGVLRGEELEAVAGTGGEAFDGPGVGVL